MDAFVKITPQKKETVPTLHNNEISLLRKYMDAGKNVIICGPTGSGKSFIVDSVLNNSNNIELNIENLQKKNSICMETNKYFFIDGYEHSIHSYKQFVDKISCGGKGKLIMTSTEVYMLPNFELILVPLRSPDVIASLVPDNPCSYQAAVKCKGNVQNFFHYLQYSDIKDVFKTSKEIVTDILCTPGSFDLSSTIHEHGHTCDVIHGNYLSSKNCDIPKIMESLSIADIYDIAMYKGNWEYMPYYIESGIATPKYYLGSEIQPDKIRPGSSWTKYGNYKMRQQKLKNIQCNHSTPLGIDELSVIRQYAASGNLDLLVEYKLNPSDFDVMNHLALDNKMKPNEVMRVKKKLRSITNEL